MRLRWIVMISRSPVERERRGLRRLRCESQPQKHLGMSQVSFSQYVDTDFDVLFVCRNLCACAWKEKHPNGLTDAYEKYWDRLSDANRKVRGCYIFPVLYLMSFLKIWIDKSAKLKEMVSDYRDRASCFINDIMSYH